MRKYIGAYNEERRSWILPWFQGKGRIRAHFGVYEEKNFRHCREPPSAVLHQMLWNGLLHP